MKIGLLMPFSEATVSPAPFARKAEELGFESLWVPEHAVIPAKDRLFMSRGGVANAYELMGDLFVVLSMAAAATSSLGLATGICVLPDRNPIVTAKEVATLDLFSGGRLMFGIGRGSLPEATRMMGLDPGRPWARIADYVAAMRALWSDEVASWRGEFVSFDELICYPKPRQKGGPPVYIGSVSANRSLLRRIAKWADGWCPCSDALHNPAGVTPELLEQSLSDLRRDCEEQGRDFSAINVTLCDISLMAGIPGDVQQARDRKQRFAQAGADRYVLVIPLSNEGNFEANLDRLAAIYLS